MSNPVINNGPLEGAKGTLENVADKLPLPGPEKYKIVWLFLVIAGGGLLLLYLIHRNAQPVTATKPAQSAQDILDQPSTTATHPVPSSPNQTVQPKQPAPGKSPIPLPTMGRVNHGRPEQPQKSPSKPVTPHPSQSGYTVHAGDTLSEIASSHHTSVTSLYTANRATIDNTARQHGHSSNAIDWIYPGETLVIP